MTVIIEYKTVDAAKKAMLAFTIADPDRSLDRNFITLHSTDIRGLGTIVMKSMVDLGNATTDINSVNVRS